MAEHLVIRPAVLEDLPATERIETAADALLIRHLSAVDWPPSTSSEERAALPGFVLVGEDTAAEADSLVGFVHVLEVDDQAHLEQISVLPHAGRRGIGRALVEAAKAAAAERGYDMITLRTYRDVPWNAPFYASCGFRASVPSTSFLRRLVDVESALGLARYGERIQMTAVL